MDANPSMSSDIILELEHLSMKFGGLVAIGDLSFQAKRGEITALIGPNGAGKTTVFNCITGFYKPTEGMIRFTGKGGEQFLLERLADFQITAKAKVARTFQNIRLFSGMTVLENLLVAQHNKLMKASGYTILGLLGIGPYKQVSAESIEIAKHWLEKADLVERADDPAGDLPYGAQRRLEIARAMCTGPELLCLDEPAAGLNPKESLALNTLLMDIKHNTGTSILLIEHDMSVVMQISDHVVVLEYGRKISDGNPESVRTDPRVIAAYLGVDDEEVTEVLAEVGDEDVIEELDTGPDAAHGPSSSASLMAGPVSDTMDHGADGERVTVARGASKAAQIDAKTARAASSAAPARTKRSAGPATTGAKDGPASEPAKPPQRKASSANAPRTAGSGSMKTPPAKPTARIAAEKAAMKTTAAATKPTLTAKAGKAGGATPKAARGGRTGAPASGGISNRLTAPRGGKADNLTRIKGIGTVNERKLNDHGIFHFDQIAAWKKADIEAAEAYLAFDGRIVREGWIDQAKLLAKGKETEFSKRVDAGKVATSHAAPTSAREPEKRASTGMGKRGGVK